jgi:hypothetical protein
VLERSTHIVAGAIGVSAYKEGDTGGAERLPAGVGLQKDLRDGRTEHKRLKGRGLQRFAAQL